MKIAILAATHGNEPLGLNVLKALEGKSYTHTYEGFIANPEALKQKVRYVDTDLNRCFGPDGVRKGVEGKRAQELTEQIKGQFDFLLDIHTTTSDMGLTVIPTTKNERTRQAAAYLQHLVPELKIIETTKLDENCTYTNYLAPASLTIEVGATANNVIRSDLYLPVLKMVEGMLDWNEQKRDLSELVWYKSFGDLYYPDKDGSWMIHPKFEGKDFTLMKKGDPYLLHLSGKEEIYEGEDTFPIFINEAAYQELFLAMTLTRKMKGWS